MEEPSYVVLSALGPNRPGLVAEVTDYLSAHGANVEDSRMAVLGAEFGMMILVSGTREQLAVVGRDIGDLRGSTRARHHPAPHQVALRAPTRARHSVHRGGRRLQSRGHRAQHRAGAARVRANIVSLETTTYEAPVTGSPLFRMEARVDLPKELTITKLRAALAPVADEENLDIEVRPLFGQS